MIWANDKRKIGKYVEFVAEITTYDLRKEMHEFDIQNQCRKSQKKAGESIPADCLQPPSRKVPREKDGISNSNQSLDLSLGINEL